MLPLGLVEVSRTGIVAIARGPEGMYGDEERLRIYIVYPSRSAS